MPLTIYEKIRIITKRRNMTLTDLANKMNISKQSLYQKLNKKSFSEIELQQIASILDCTFETVFIMNDTGEKI